MYGALYLESQPLTFSFHMWQILNITKLILIYSITLMLNVYTTRSQDNAAGIVSRLQTGWLRDFPLPAGVKRPGHEASHTPLSSAKIKNE